MESPFAAGVILRPSFVTPKPLPTRVPQRLDSVTPKPLPTGVPLRLDSEEGQRNSRVQHWLDVLKTDGAAADDDDNESGYSSNNLDEDQSSCPSDPSLSSDRSNGKFIDFKNLKENYPFLYQYWQSLWEKKELLITEERLLSPLSSHLNDNRPSSPSVPSLRSDRSKGKDDFKDEKIYLMKNICCLLLLWTLLAFSPYLYQIWQSLLLLWTFSAFSPFQDDDSILRRSAPSIRRDRSNGQIIDFRQLKECHPVLNICCLLLLWILLTFTPYLYQIWQSLVLLLLFLAFISPDLDDDRSSNPSDPSLRRDQSVEKIFSLKEIQRLDKVGAQLFLLFIWTFLVFSSHQFLSDDDQPSGRIIHLKKSGKRNSFLNICWLLFLWTLLAFSPYLNICCLLLLWTYLASPPDQMKKD